jgi:hypothetical protein
MTDELLWYAAYGSNMHRERFDRYLTGGEHPGGARHYPGCRDPGPPRRTGPLTLPGRLYFATESPVWGGGRAFAARAGAGRTAATGYLIGRGQFADIAAQEMYREPGADLDLTGIIAGAARLWLGPGRYETLVVAGELDGWTVLTFTAPWGCHEVEWRAPSAGYLRHLGAGLLATHGWSAAEAGAYLAQCPGAEGHWAAEEIAALLETA